MGRVVSLVLFISICAATSEGHTTMAVGEIISCHMASLRLRGPLSTSSITLNC